MRVLTRYLLAFLLLLYGFAKTNGSQFTILDSELDKPMGQVSGFWLTWYYFGYSPLYGHFIALAEIGAGMLLLFRRTTLLGACVAAPMLANIVLIDLSYGVEATKMAMLMLAMSIALIWPDRDQLIAVFSAAVTPEKSRSRRLAAWGARIAIAALACGITYWAANYNNRAPTPIDGIWDLVQADPPDRAAQLPATVFFEYNRAHLTVFKSSAGEYATHHFEIAPAQGLRIWEHWMKKGSPLFDGTYSLDGRELRVTGTMDRLGPVKLLLRKR